MQHLASRTFDQHSIETKLESIASVYQRMNDAANQTTEHFRLLICISSFLEVVFFREDKLFECARDAPFGDLVGKERHICLVISFKGVRTRLPAIRFTICLLVISQVIGEVLLRDRLRRLERGTLNATITLIVILDDLRGTS